MWGSETFTTVVSSTSMKVLDITAMAISQGLGLGRADELEGCSWTHCANILRCEAGGNDSAA